MHVARAHVHFCLYVPLAPVQEVLRGQKLQGVLTSNEVQEILRARSWEEQYPLFTTINRIINGLLEPTWVLR